MPRGRKPIVVTREELQNTLIAVEWDGPFASRTALWEAVAASDWAKNLNLSAQVAMLKANNLIASGQRLLINTPIGQRGKVKGCTNTNQGKRTKKTPLNVVELQTVFQKYPKAVARTIGGSRQSAIKLMCLDCSTGGKKEIALCAIKRCPLWSFRPYQGSYKNEQ
jgi:hypothetical protein